MSSGNIIKLDIGGTIFKTSKSTLTKFDGFFKTMLETDVPLEKDEHGVIFIDRSPKHFELILNYMRDRFMNIPESKSDIQEIQIEAQYYLLDGLVELCNAQKSATMAEKDNKTKDHCLKTFEDLLNAVNNCTKKAVILIPYRTTSANDRDIPGLIQNTKFLMKYSADFDVYFCSYGLNLDWYADYKLFDKSTGQCDDISRHHLDGFMKNRYGVE